MWGRSHEADGRERDCAERERQALVKASSGRGTPVLAGLRLRVCGLFRLGKCTLRVGGPQSGKKQTEPVLAVQEGRRALLFLQIWEPFISSPGPSACPSPVLFLKLAHLASLHQALAAGPTPSTGSSSPSWRPHIGTSLWRTR